MNKYKAWRHDAEGRLEYVKAPHVAVSPMYEDQQRIIELCNQVEFLNKSIETLTDMVEKRSSENKALRECVEFYADPETYCLYEDIDWAGNWIAERVPQALRRVGHTAKQALAKHRESDSNE